MSYLFSKGYTYTRHFDTSMQLVRRWFCSDFHVPWWSCAYTCHTPAKTSNVETPELICFPPPVMPHTATALNNTSIFLMTHQAASSANTASSSAGSWVPLEIHPWDIADIGCHDLGVALFKNQLFLLENPKNSNILFFFHRDFPCQPCFFSAIFELSLQVYNLGASSELRLKCEAGICNGHA